MHQWAIIEHRSPRARHDILVLVDIYRNKQWGDFFFIPGQQNQDRMRVWYAAWMSPRHPKTHRLPFCTTKVLATSWHRPKSGVMPLKFNWVKLYIRHATETTRMNIELLHIIRVSMDLNRHAKQELCGLWRSSPSRIIASSVEILLT